MQNVLGSTKLLRLIRGPLENMQSGLAVIFDRNLASLASPFRSFSSLGIINKLLQSVVQGARSKVSFLYV